MGGRLFKLFFAAFLFLQLSGCHHISGPVHRGGRAKAAGNCLSQGCHSSVISSPVLHAPVEEGDCDACHEPLTRQQEHPDGFGSEFGTVMARSPLVCFDCHAQADGRPMNEHKPWRMGHCRECHEAHGSEMPSLLKRDVNGLCLYCHRDLAARLERASSRHVTPAETCVTKCHSPHRSPRAHLLREGEDTLCVTCHGVSGECATGQGADTDPRAEACTACHYAHASVLPKMLKKNRFLPNSSP